jgi:hypothetical protein
LAATRRPDRSTIVFALLYVLNAVTLVATVAGFYWADSHHRRRLTALEAGPQERLTALARLTDRVKAAERELDRVARQQHKGERGLDDLREALEAVARLQAAIDERSGDHGRRLTALEVFAVLRIANISEGGLLAAALVELNLRISAIENIASPEPDDTANEPEPVPAALEEAVAGAVAAAEDTAPGDHLDEPAG